MPIESFVTTFFADWLNWTFFWWRSFCFVAERNRMRQQVADRSPQRHATLPTYYKILLRTEVLLRTTLTVNATQVSNFQPQKNSSFSHVPALHKKPTPTIPFVYAIFFTSFGQRHAIFLFALGRSPQRHTTWHDAQRRGTTLGSQSATTHDCSVDAVRNDVRQLHITLFKVSGQDATN